MKGSETKLLDFMEGNKNRYIIPVYQRKYDWKYENCRQLFEDLKKIINDNRESHFFGSIVSQVVGNGGKTEYHIIDGQQRLTTITLLLLAIRNLIVEGKIPADNHRLDEQIMSLYLTAPFATDENDKIKLCPVKSDRNALSKLFGDPEDYQHNSNLTVNYYYFYNEILNGEISVLDLYDAIGKLEIICITLDNSDNAQLIFESLNSTGLALTEGDKIRNYVLMGLPTKMQNEYYDKYWAKIEKLTDNNVSAFIRDYLSVKQQKTPVINNVYAVFKKYAIDLSFSIESLLEDILQYARYYNKLLVCKSELNKELDDCLYRLKRLDIAVVRPFLMEVFRLNAIEKLTNVEVLKIFNIIETYLFRRNICEVPANALNKIFVNLNNDIIRYDNSTDNYVEKLVYALLSKKESSRFPNDSEFLTDLSNKQVYLMRGRYKDYLFERFENYGTVETKDVYKHLDNNTYSIEHIMPQHLSNKWVESLGENANEIHGTWLHRLANLTLTGYNSSLSNNDFIIKRDEINGGFKASGLRMNQKIATKESWGEKELEERNKDMIEQAKKIWPYPSTNFVPAEKEQDTCTLDDENYDIVGRDISKYSYQNAEQTVISWTDMFENVVKFLHQGDKSVLTALAYDKTSDDIMVKYVSNDEADLRSALKIDENIYIEKNTSTNMKLHILRKIFKLFNADPMDLVFYLRNISARKKLEKSKLEIRKKYWDYALPIIKEKHIYTGCYSGCESNNSNSLWGAFGIGGFSIGCIAISDEARVDFYLGKSATEKNKKAFDLLFNHKAEIENKLGVSLEWNRLDTKKASYISYQLKDVDVTNEADWDKMANFHGQWSYNILNVMLEYLLDEKELRKHKIALICREWANLNYHANYNPKYSKDKFNRFTTNVMSEILPDIPNSPSGWNTDNHYFYEIVNNDGETAFVKLAISSKNMSLEQLEICDKINKFYPTKVNKEEWQWRTVFRSSTFNIGENIVKEEIFAQLDKCLEEIKIFEADIKSKLQ